MQPKMVIYWSKCVNFHINKQHRWFGIKKFKVCDSVTGYVWHIESYSGKTFRFEEICGAVMNLCVRPMYGTRDTTSLRTISTPSQLWQTLLEAGTPLTGTVGGTSKGLPPSPRWRVARRCSKYRRHAILRKRSQRKHVDISDRKFVKCRPSIPQSDSGIKYFPTWSMLFSSTATSCTRATRMGNSAMPWLHVLCHGGSLDHRGPCYVSRVAFSYV